MQVLHVSGTSPLKRNKNRRQNSDQCAQNSESLQKEIYFLNWHDSVNFKMSCLVKGCGFGNGNKKKKENYFEGVQRHTIPQENSELREKWLLQANRQSLIRKK